MSLRILQLAPRVPYPPMDGGSVAIFNVTRHLAERGNSVTLLALDPSPSPDSEGLREYCDLIVVPHSNRNSVWGVCLNLLSPLPYTVAKYSSHEYSAVLERMLEERSFDIVHIETTHMARYGALCRSKKGLPVVLRAHDVAATILERYTATAGKRTLTPWLNLQVRRMRRYEAWAAEKMDCCCMITPDDKRRMLELAPTADVRFVPAGVETRLLEVKLSTPIPQSLAYFGLYDWQPNRDAVEWFLSRILPRVAIDVPGVRFAIVGKGSEKYFAGRATENISIRGYVIDIAEEVRRHMLTIVPLRIGGGMRLKILESFALRVPVVSTSIGCEGIAVRDGEHLLIADTAEDFAAATVRLLRDPDLRNRLAANAYALVNEHYRWDRIAEEFERTYHELIALRQNPDGREKRHQ